MTCFQCKAPLAKGYEEERFPYHTITWTVFRCPVCNKTRAVEAMPGGRR